MDLGLAPELRLDRVHRQAIALHAAVAAALAAGLVDDHAHRGIGQLAALAQPPLLRGAPLVVDERRDTRDVAEHPLRLVEAVAMPHLDAPRPHGGLRVLVPLAGAPRDSLC